MSFGDRAGTRNESLSHINDKFGVSVNPLTLARDRRRLGDVNILDFNSHAIRPMLSPMVTSKIQPIINPIVRRMGESTLDQRRRGNTALWAGTPVVGNVSVLGNVAILGDPDFDITGVLSEFDRVGWSWDRRSNELCAFLSSGGKTFKVKIPLVKIKQVFNEAVRENGGADNHFKEPTLNGFFKNLGRALKKVVSAPKRFVKDPRKFIRDAGKKLTKLVRGVGKIALKVASSPVFAGVMTAMAALPPLTAVGGAGLAAYAAANAVKPAFKAIDTTIKTIDSVKSSGKAIKALTAKNGIKADSVTRNFKSGLDKLPPQGKAMMIAALQSTDARQLTPKERKARVQNAIWRFSRRNSSIRRVS